MNQKAMRSNGIYLLILGMWLSAAGFLSASGQSSNSVASQPVYVPDTSHANGQLPPGILTWDAEQKGVDVTNGQDLARFVFTFTNVSPDPVVLLGGSGSCSCTTVQLPETPWLVQPGTSGSIGVTIDLAGKSGTLFKEAIISTDKGVKNLTMQVNIQPAPPLPAMTDAQRAQAMAAAKVDRQAVFRGDCVKCHANNVKDLYGQDLFNAVCAVCHEAKPRPTMVPDLHHLKDPTSLEFWRAWITVGKPGSLMPAFASSQGGPLSEVQISTLAAYLASAIPAQPAASAK